MYGFIVPDVGLALLARATAGEELTLSRVMVGKGVPEGGPAGLTNLVDPVAAATSSVPSVEGSKISFLVEYRNDMNGGLAQGFSISEFGIFARIGVEPETLLYYGSLGDHPQWISPYTAGLESRRFPVSIAVTNAVTVTLDYPAGSFATSEEVAALMDDLTQRLEGEIQDLRDTVDEVIGSHVANHNNPHSVTAAQVGADPAGTSSAAVAAHNASAAPHANMGWAKLAEVYTKPESFADNTKSAYGLPNTAVPDDGFRKLAPTLNIKKGPRFYQKCKVAINADNNSTADIRFGSAYSTRRYMWITPDKTKYLIQESDTNWSMFNAEWQKLWTIIVPSSAWAMIGFDNDTIIFASSSYNTLSMKIYKYTEESASLALSPTGSGTAAHVYYTYQTYHSNAELMICTQFQDTGGGGGSYVYPAKYDKVANTFTTFAQLRLLIISNNYEGANIMPTQCPNGIVVQPRKDNSASSYSGDAILYFIRTDGTTQKVETKPNNSASRGFNLCATSDGFFTLCISEQTLKKYVTTSGTAVLDYTVSGVKSVNSMPMILDGNDLYTSDTDIFNISTKESAIVPQDSYIGSFSNALNGANFGSGTGQVFFYGLGSIAYSTSTVDDVRPKLVHPLKTFPIYRDTLSLTGCTIVNPEMEYLLYFYGGE